MAVVVCLRQAPFGKPYGRSLRLAVCDKLHKSHARFAFKPFTCLLHHSALRVVVHLLLEWVADSTLSHVCMDTFKSDDPRPPTPLVIVECTGWRTAPGELSERHWRPCRSSSICLGQCHCRSPPQPGGGYGEWGPCQACCPARFGAIQHKCCVCGRLPLLLGQGTCSLPWEQPHCKHNTVQYCAACQRAIVYVSLLQAVFICQSHFLRCTVRLHGRVLICHKYQNLAANQCTLLSPAQIDCAQSLDWLSRWSALLLP